MFTIKDVLKMEGLELIAGEKGIEREIKSVNIVEVPEVLKWMNGGELLFSAGYIFYDEIDKACKLLKEMNEFNISGLAIKPGQYLDKIPEKLIECANEIDFPLLQVDLNTPYSKFMDPINKYLFEKENITLELLNRFYESILKDAIDIDWKRICQKVSFYTKRNVYILDSEGKIMFDSGDDSIIKVESFFLEKALKIYDENKDARYWEINNKQKFLVKKITLENSYYLVINYFNNDNLYFFNKIIEYTQLLISLEYNRKNNSFKNNCVKKNRLFNKLLNYNYYDKKRIYSEGYKYNIDFSNTSIIITFNFIFLKRFDNKIIENFIYNMDKKLRYNKVGYLILRIKNKISYLFNVETENSIDTYIEIIDEVLMEKDNLKYFNLYIGMSDFIRNISDVSKNLEISYYISNVALNNNNSFRILSFDDIGIYKVLYILKNNFEMNNYITKELDPILKYDKKHDSDLLNTLKVYYENNGKLNKTAADLYLHKNTITYRLNKISDLTGKNLYDYANISNLLFCIKLYELKLI